MLIEAKKLVEFFKRFDDVSVEAIINFTDAGVVVGVISPTNIVRMDATLNKSAFKQYDAIGEIGVGDINILKKIVERFSGDVSLVVEGNLLTVKGEGKKVETELMDIQFIQKVSDLPELSFTESFSIDSGKIMNFFTDASINKGIAYDIVTEPKLVKFENDGKFKFQHTVPVDAVGGVSVRFGEILSSILSNVSGVVTLNLKTDYPMGILEITDEMSVKYLVAPRVDRNE